MEDVYQAFLFGGLKPAIHIQRCECVGAATKVDSLSCDRKRPR